MPEFALTLVLSATGGRAGRRPAPATFGGVSTDTRTLQPGDLYVALKGERLDGHSFVAEAFRRGAGAALVSRRLRAAGPQIVVPDTRCALGALAAAHRATLELRVIGITGSVGKTSTKEMLGAILARGWRTARSPRNYNNEIGVPLTLLGLDASCQAAVIEMAMRGRGQIAYLARVARPQLGLITNIGVSHLELLGSRDAIAESKAELLQELPPEGTAVLNADDDYFALLSRLSAAPVVSFGSRAGADVRVRDVSLTPEGRTRFRLTGRMIEAEITSGAPGRHHALNAAAAAAAALRAGAKPEWVVQGLTAYESADRRGRLARAPGGYTVIDDSYNAAPDSMRAALDLLSDLPGRRKWAVLGDMKELGNGAADAHCAIGRLAGAAGLAGLVTVGELGRHLADGAREAGVGDVRETSDNAAAAAAIAARLGPDDVVLVKGSRAMEMEQIVAALLASPDLGSGKGKADR